MKKIVKETYNVWMSFLQNTARCCCFFSSLSDIIMIYDYLKNTDYTFGFLF